MTNGKRETVAELVRITAERELLRRFVLSKPKSADLPKKVSARLTVRRGRKILFFEESYPGGRVRQFALSPDEIVSTLPALCENYLQADLSTPVGDVVLLRSKSGTETLRGEARLRRALEDADGAPLLSTLTALDREPRRILAGNEPFLFALGVSDEKGRVHDKRQPKYRQINRFLELVADIYDELPGGGEPLLVYDLCCGKSYLSFALYHYLTAIRGRRVEMLCVDLKADVLEFCRGVARDAGFLSDGDGCGMVFRAEDIRKLPRNRRPDLVVSLHACDTATDYALAYAVKRGVKHIFSVPCCQHEINLSIQKGGELDLLLEHGIIKERVCALLTDSIRAAVLEGAGYAVDVIEFVDFEHSPKNLMLRARFTGKRRSQSRERAEVLRRQYGFEQSLLDLIPGSEK